MSPDRLVYTVPQAAELIGIDADTVYVLIKRGHLTARRLHATGHLRILATDLGAYLASLTAEPTVTSEPKPKAEAPKPQPKRDRRRVVRLLDVFKAPAGAACKEAL